MARVAVVQNKPQLGDVARNIDSALGQAARLRADLFLFPELAFTGYNFSTQSQVRRLAESWNEGPTARALALFARQKKAHVCYGFVEIHRGRLYNSAALFSPSKPLGVYRKIHLYGREKKFFSPGRDGFRVFKTALGPIGLMICFDWYFPESMRTLALKGAQIVLHPANLVLPHGPSAMVTRCLENRVYAATANRVGTERGGERPLTYIGQSQVVSPRGEILFRLDKKNPGASAALCDLKMSKDKNINRLNNLFRDRRPRFYA